MFCWSIIDAMGITGKEHEPGVGKHALLEEIIGNLKAATENAIELVKAVLRTDSRLCDENCECRKSLEPAVWTQPDAIDAAAKNELKVLFQ